MNRDRWLGLGLVALGTAVALFVRTADPFPGPPLYDGVPIIEPYLWLDPPPDLPGGAEGATDSVGVAGGRNDVVIVETAEQPPQAQLFGVRGSMQLPAGATSVQVAITPVEAPAISPSDGYIDGNVYRFAVTDQAGNVVTAKADASVSVVLRPADQTLLDATIERFDGVAWRPLETTPDQVSAFIAVVTDFGDFAVVARGASPYVTAAPLPTPTAGPTAASSPSAEASNTASSAPSPSDVGAPGQPAFVPVLAAVGLIAVIAIAAFAVRHRRRRRDDGRPTGWSR